MSTTRLALCAAALLATAPLSAQNQALSFVNAGTNQHVDVPASLFTGPTRELTIEAWIRYTPPTGGGQPTIAYHSDAGGGQAWTLFISEGITSYLAFFVGNAGVRTIHNPAQLLNWTHVAATYDGSTMSIYLDGQQVATRALSSIAAIPGGGALRIGNGDPVVNGQNVWNGEIDELRIWPVARTAAEINETKDGARLLVPNGVSFQFDGDTLDTSQFLLGVTVGTPSFVPGAPVGVLTAVGVSPFGAPTTTCGGDLLRVTAGSTTLAGNLDFELVCTEAPAGATGGVLLSVGALAAPFPFLGVNVWVDPLGLLPFVPAVTASPSGTARLPIALDPNSQIGLTIHTQFVFLDAVCGSSGLVASEAGSIIVQ